MNSITFGELIRHKRQELGKPIREVAAKVGIDASILSKVERNQLTASASIIPLLAEVLKISYQRLQEKYWSERIYHEIKQEDFGKEALEIALRRLEKEGAHAAPQIKANELIAKIQSYAHRQPIEKLWLFGSFARKEASLDSDIDLIVRFSRSMKIDLFDYIGIKQELEDLTGRKVDLVEEGQELPRIKPIIEQEKKLIYERKAI